MKQINIRFLAQGMVKVDPREAPNDLPSLPPHKVWDWAQQYFSKLTPQQLLEGVSRIDIDEDANPDCVEIQDDDGDYLDLAHSQVWAAWMWDDREPVTAGIPGTYLATADYKKLMEALKEMTELLEGTLFVHIFDEDETKEAEESPYGQAIDRARQIIGKIEGQA